MNRRVDILLTMAQLYREKLPDLPAVFTEHWEGVVRGILGAGVDLHITTVHTSGQFAAAVERAEAGTADRLVVLPMAYAPSGAASVLAATTLPLVVVSSARDYTLPVNMDSDHLLANQGMHAAIDLCNYLGRCGRRYGFVAGHVEQEEFRTRFRSMIDGGPLPESEPPPMARAVPPAAGEGIPGMSDAVDLLEHGRVGCVGGPFAGMMDLSFDSDNQREALGFDIVDVGVERLSTQAGQCTPEQIGAIARQLEAFAIDADVSEEELDASLRYACAVESLVEQHRLDALAVNFMALTAAGVETMPFLGASRLMARGVGYGAEGDVLVAMLCAALDRLSAKATFIELFSPDYRNNELLLSHMGECNYALASDASAVRLRAKHFNWGDCLRPIVPVFQLKPGRATLVSLSESPDARSFRLLAFEATVTECEEHPNLVVPYARVRLGRPVVDFLADYSAAGGTHHAVLAYGIGTHEVATLASRCGLECRAIDTKE